MASRKNISITSVSVISLLLLTVSVFFVFGFMYYNHKKNIELIELKSDITKSTNQLSQELSIAIWNFDDYQINGILESAFFDKNIEGIVVEYYDNDKKIFSVARDEKNNSLKTYSYRIPKKNNDLLFIQNVKYSNRVIAKISIYVTTKYVFDELRDEVILITLFVLFSTTFIMIGVYYIFYFIIIRPLKMLENFSLAINFENYNSSKLVKKNFFKELENLSYSLQKMVTTLNVNYKKLEESEHKFKEMSNLLPQTVYEMDVNGNLMFINKKGMDLFEIKQDELNNGLTMFDVISHKSIEFAKKNMKLILNGELGTDGNEYIGVKRDGTEFPIMIYSSAIFEGNTAIGLRGVGIDLTEQRKNEAKLNELMQLNFIKEKESEKMRAIALIEGQEKERLRISKEIHDGIGQMMTGVKLSSEGIDISSIKSQVDVEKLEYTKSLIYKVMSELRQVSSDLSPTFLYSYGLFLSIEQLTLDVSKISNIHIELNSNIQNVRFSSLIEITIYRIIQEAINNVLKYSKAQNLKINLIQDAEFLELFIADDGIGADLTKCHNDGLKNGNGLKNIASRANLINANFSILTSPDNGFQITLQIPVEKVI